MRITDDNLHGRIVLSSDGRTIGEITKLYFDGTELRVDAIQVKLRKESAEALGINRSVLHAASLEIPARSIQSVGDAVLLSVPLDALKHQDDSQAPTLPREGQPLPARDVIARREANADERQQMSPREAQAEREAAEREGRDPQAPRPRDSRLH